MQILCMNGPGEVNPNAVRGSGEWWSRGRITIASPIRPRYVPGIIAGYAAKGKVSGTSPRSQPGGPLQRLQRAGHVEVDDRVELRGQFRSGSSGSNAPSPAGRSRRWPAAVSAPAAPRQPPLRLRVSRKADIPRHGTALHSFPAGSGRTCFRSAGRPSQGRRHGTAVGGETHQTALSPYRSRANCPRFSSPRSATSVARASPR